MSIYKRQGRAFFEKKKKRNQKYRKKNKKIANWVLTIEYFHVIIIVVKNIFSYMEENEYES